MASTSGTRAPRIVAAVVLLLVSSPWFASAQQPARVDASLLPSFFNLTEASAQRGGPRITVDGQPCDLPIEIGGRLVHDCIPFWDGLEYCRSSSSSAGGEVSFFACIPKGTSLEAYHARLAARAASSATVGSLLDSIAAEEESEEEALDESDVVAGEALAKEARAPAGPVMRGPLVISEFMASNERTFQDADGSFPDWIEIQNASPDPVALAGWAMTDDAREPRKWTFPADSGTLAPDAYLVLFASGKNESVMREDGKRAIHTSFKLSSDGGALRLSDPAGAVSSEVAAYPPQYDDVSFGRAEGAGPNRVLNFIQNAQMEGKREVGEGGKGGKGARFGYLQTPTPNTRNSFLRVMGPAVFGVTHDPEPRLRGGQDFTVRASIFPQGLSPGQAFRGNVSLHVRSNFLPEYVITMTPSSRLPSKQAKEEGGGEGGEGGEWEGGRGGIPFEATIPGHKIQPGSMLRWYVTARMDGSGGVVYEKNSRP